MYATSVLDAAIDNQGLIAASGGNLNINVDTSASGYTLTNEATGTIDVGDGQTLNVGGNELEDYGLIELDGTATMQVTTVSIDRQGYLDGANTSTLQISGSLLGNTTSVTAFVQPGTVLFDGSGTPQNPQQLEVMEIDQSNVLSGYKSGLAYNNLEIGGNTYVQLVDNSSNSGGTPEAVYVTNLQASPQSLELNGLKLYTGLAEPVSWTGDGDNNLWSNAANWSTNQLPASNDDVTIGLGDTVVADTPAVIHSLDIQGSVSLIEQNTLTVSAGITNDGTIQTQGWGGTDNLNADIVNSGTITVSNYQTLTVNGNLTNSGTINLGSDGTPNTLTVTGTLVNNGIIQTQGYGMTDSLNANIDNSGTISVGVCSLAINQASGAASNTVTNEPGGTITVSNGQALDLGGSLLMDSDSTLNNYATINQAAGSVVSMDTGSMLNNWGGSMQYWGGYNIEGEGAAIGGDDGGVGTIDNYGQFQKTGGTGSATLAVEFDNYGTVQVDSGSLTFGSGVIPLSITPNNQTETYGQWNALTGTAVPGVTVSYTSPGNGWGSVLGSPYTITTTLTDPNNALSADTVTLNTGLLTVTPAPTAVSVTPTAADTDGQAVTLTATVSTPARGCWSTAARCNSWSTAATCKRRSKLSTARPRSRYLPAPCRPARTRSPPCIAAAATTPAAPRWPGPFPGPARATTTSGATRPTGRPAPFPAAAPT